MRIVVLGLVLMVHVASAEDIFTNEFEQLVTTRINYLELKDPHIFADLAFFGCSDITNTTPVGDGVNPLLNNNIQGDDDGDGLLDLSLLTTHNTDQPEYLVNRSTIATFVEGDCDVSFNCVFTAGAPMTSFSTINQDMGICLDVEPGTIRPYTPAIIVPEGPCYVTETQSVTLDLNGIILDLNDYQQSLRYEGGITTDQGFHKGFLTEASAESVIIPPEIPEIGGQTLASTLRGHHDNCSVNSDMDVHPILGDGWWMYFNSTSDLVELSAE